MKNLLDFSSGGADQRVYVAMKGHKPRGLADRLAALQSGGPLDAPDWSPAGSVYAPRSAMYVQRKGIPSAVARPQ